MKCLEVYCLNFLHRPFPPQQADFSRKESLFRCRSRNKEDHEIEKTREENSKQIIDFIRSKLKKEKEMVKEELQLKTVERPLVKKRANMKGVTWARWRLMEYQKKKNLEISKREIKNIKEENDLETMADTEMKIDDVSNLKGNKDILEKLQGLKRGIHECFE